MSPIAEATRIMRMLDDEPDRPSVSMGAAEAVVRLGKRVVTIRGWEMSKSKGDETPLDWIPLSSEAAAAWLKGSE